MKYLLLITAIFLGINSGFTQHNSSSDRSENLRITFDYSSRANNYISQKITLSARPEAAFYTVAVYFSNPFSGSLQYRVIGEEWQSLLPFHEANHPDRMIFELLFLPNKMTNIQFKTSEKPSSDLFVRSLSLSGGNQTDLLPVATLRDDCDCPQPDICGRDCWCPDGDCPTDATPVATAPTHIIVHHSASASTSNNFPAVVRSYWDFHVNINGWDDIGYNWLIDAEGIIYEGRGSGTQGAHFSCMNTETTGICMIGNFENDTPAPTAIEALENMIAWEACDKNIVPADSSNHITSGALLAHISGHRDGNDLPNSCTNTVCPGENLYPLLSGIRQRVTDKTCLNDLVNIRNNRPAPFQIYPNPSTGNFRLSGDLEQISALHLYSGSGIEKKLNVQPNGHLNLTGNGFFILKIIRKDGSVTTHKLLVRQ